MSAVEGAAPPAGEETSHGKERSRRAWWTTLTALGGRGIGVLVSLVSVPLTIGFLDAERYGLWITIGSFLAWLGIADLGLGNGLTNALAAARAKGDQEGARAVVSTSFVVVGAVSLAMAILFALCFPFVPWARVFAVSSRVDPRELDLTVALCAAIFFAGFPLGLLDRVFAGCQEGYVANYWSTVASALTAAALILAVRFGHGLPALVLALSGVGLALRVASAFHFFRRRHPELRPARSLYRKDLARRLLATGTTFLVVQLAALGMWQNDNIIIAQLFGAEAVGPYSIAFRLANTFIGFVGMWLGPLWPAYADAGARGEYGWIRDKVRVTSRVSLAATAAAAVGLVAVGGEVIRIWTRSTAMVPSRHLLLATGVCMVLVVFCLAHAMALNGLGKMRGQMIYGLAAAGVNVALSIVLGRAMGVVGVCWATCIAALIPAVLAPIELRMALRELEAGAGEKAGSEDPAP